jgi:hypothetical protein
METPKLHNYDRMPLPLAELPVVLEFVSRLSPEIAPESAKNPPLRWWRFWSDDDTH